MPPGLLHALLHDLRDIPACGQNDGHKWQR
jgi:hypothetical protein